MDIKQKAKSGIKWTTIDLVGNSIFQLVQISILTRILPKEAFGIVAMALFIINFTNIFVDLGFTSAIIHKNNPTKNEYSSIYWLNLIIAFILYVTLLINTKYISSFYDTEELNQIIPVLGLNLIFIAVGKLHLTIMQKKLWFKPIMIINIISRLIGLVCAVVLALNNWGVYSLIISTLLSSFLSNFTLFYYNYKTSPIKFHLNINEIKEYIKIGCYSLGSQLISFFSTDIDILIIGKLLGPKELGLYSLSKQIILRLYSLVNPIVTNVLTPLLAILQKDIPTLKKYFLNSTYLLANINIPIYLLVVIYSSEILTFLYGKDYIEAKWILSFLSIAYCIYTLMNPVGSLQIATGRTDIGLKWSIFSIIITPITIYISALKDINTVALSRAILSIVLIIPLWLIQLRPMIRIKFTEYINTFYAPFLISILITTLYFYLFSMSNLHDEFLLVILIKFALTISLYVIILFFLDRNIFNIIAKYIKK